jgi:hypothetical protein
VVDRTSSDDDHCCRKLVFFNCRKLSILNFIYLFFSNIADYKTHCNSFLVYRAVIKKKVLSL